MSGVEAAGFILGAIPLIISAAEHYREGFEPLREWWKFETEFQSFVEELEVQDKIFSNNIEKLIQPFVSDREMDAIINDRSLTAIHPQLEENVQERLADSYKAYMSVVKKVNGIVSALQDQLGIKEGKIRWIDHDGWEKQLKKMRIAFSKKKYAQVKQLRVHNDDLARLLGQRDELGPARSTWGPKAFAEFLRRIEDRASSLHSALKTGWKGCGCASDHDARLLLEKRTLHKTDREVDFQLLFQGSSEGTSWREVTTRIIKSEPPSDSGRSMAESCSSLEPNEPMQKPQMYRPRVSWKSSVTVFSHSSTSIPLKSNPTKHKPFMSRSQSSVYTLNSQRAQSTLVERTSSIASTLPPSPTTPPEPEPLEIPDLCKALDSISPEHKCLGFLTDDLQRRHGFYPLPKKKEQPHHKPLKTISLDAILSSPASTRKLTRTERLVIASTITSSFLQLQATPWLAEALDKKEIIFLHPDAEPTDPIFAKPYLHRPFPSSPPLPPNPSPSTTAPQSAPTPPPPPQTPRTALLSLGILLLELWHGARLTDQTFRAQFLSPTGQANQLTDRCAAELWHESLVGECTPELWDAIRRCLHCSFGPRPDMQSDEFRAAVLGGVVEPVERFVGLWTGERG